MVVVFGSINLDLVTRVPRLPSPGETLIGSGFASYPGGKGANQALAAARAGAVVRMWPVRARPGGRQRWRRCARGSVDAGIRAVDAPTGCATILVDDAGENAIVVVPGANERVDPDAVPTPSRGGHRAAATRSPAVSQRRTGSTRGTGWHAHRAQCGASAPADC
jgi:ribokinase